MEKSGNHLDKIGNIQRPMSENSTLSSLIFLFIVRISDRNPRDTYNQERYSQVDGGGTFGPEYRLKLQDPLR